MSDRELKNIMENEIQQRLDNPEWNYRIASRVKSRVKERARKNIFTVSLSSLASAAIIIFIFLFNTENSVQNRYNELIQTQIEGTYSEVFDKNYVSLLSSGTEDAFAYDNIDLTIDNALSSR